MEYTKYAAVGHFKCHRTLDGKKYPVVTSAGRNICSTYRK